MEKEKKENPLRKFIEESNLTLRQFSLASNIHYSSLYNVYSDKSWPRKLLAKRICKASNGKLCLQDFGYE